MLFLPNLGRIGLGSNLTMFAKPASFKPYAAIKNSERKQVLAKVEQQCGLENEEPENRQKLLPKTVQSAKAVTHGNDKITVYAESQLPLWVVTKQGTLVPTVALLLSLPDELQLRLLPIVYTVSRTLQYLKNGADFMTPGVFGELPQNAPKGTVVAIRDITTNALLATGVAMVDLGKLDPESDKGKCVQTISVVGDKLTPKTEIKPLGGAPGFGDEDDEEEADSAEEQTGGSQSEAAQPPSEVPEQSSKETTEEKPAETSSEPAKTAQEPVELVTSQLEETNLDPLSAKDADEAFMYAVNRVIREPREYPITMAGFAALLTEQMPYEHPDLQIKNTTFKKMNKLIKHAEKKGLLNSRERNGGEVLITGVNVPVNAESAANVALPSRSGNAGKKAAQQARMTVEIMYKPHPNIRTIAPNLPQNVLVDAGTLKRLAFEYITSNNLAKPGEKQIPLDENLRKALALRQVHTNVDRDDVGAQLLKNSSPFHKIVPLNTDPNQAEWKKGGIPSIQIKTERRGGNKTVTLVGQQGLQGFFIDPQEFADELRHACAGSAALTDSKGFPAITVQGNHVAKIIKVLEKRGVRPAWIKS